MKVKIGDKIYDSHDMPIMIILTNQAKENIKNMPEELLKYCEYPGNGCFSVEQIQEFMKT